MYFEFEKTLSFSTELGGILENWGAMLDECEGKLREKLIKVTYISCSSGQSPLMWRGVE